MGWNALCVSHTRRTHTLTHWPSGVVPFLGVLSSAWCWLCLKAAEYSALWFLVCSSLYLLVFYMVFFLLICNHYNFTTTTSNERPASINAFFVLFYTSVGWRFICFSNLNKTHWNWCTDLWSCTPVDDVSWRRSINGIISLYHNDPGDSVDFFNNLR